jgi:hypothetical protein
MGHPDDLIRYVVACTDLTARYIERSVRFGADRLRIADARPAMRQFDIRLRHALTVVADAHDHHGAHAPGPGDIAIADPADYRRQVQQQTQAEKARPASLDSLVASVQSQPYATMSERTCIRTHPQRLFRTYRCKGCDGAGSIACGHCGGAGRVRCNWCDGRGSSTCTSCQGGGVVTEERTTRDQDGDTQSETCSYPCTACSGGSVSCSSCSGSGRRTCSPCSGSGRITCAHCGGQGCLTRITATQTWTQPRFDGDYPQDTPAYVDATLRRAGFATLAQHGDITLRETVADREQQAATFVYACSMPFCELSVELMGRRAEWILFGKDAQIVDAGGALEAILEDDLGRLCSVAHSRKRWLPWCHVAASEVVTPFLASGLNQDIIDADCAGLAPQAIVDHVKRAVSESYVQDSLHALERLVLAAGHWSRVTWVLALVVLALPWALLADAALVRIGHVDVASFGRTGIAWAMGLSTLPFTLAGCCLARWTSTRWLRQAGGTVAVTWADRRGLLPGTWTALLAMVAAAVVTGAAFHRWPL